MCIEDLFARISLDKRHHIVFLMRTIPIEKRSFADWQMGFNKIHDPNAELIDDYKRQQPEFFIQCASELDSLLEQFKH